MVIKTSFQRLLAILTLLTILAFGQLFMASSMGLTANAEESDDTAGASEDDGDGDWDYLLGEQHDNLPFEPVERSSNNVLLGGGLAVCFLALGGALIIDRRN